MTFWNPYDPCSVGDLRLPAQFETLRWAPLYCDTRRAWVLLPLGLALAINCPTDHSVEVEIWRWGSVTLTRSATDKEIDAYYESEWA